MAKAKTTLATLGQQIEALQRKIGPIEVELGLQPRESLGQRFRKNWKTIVFFYAVPVIAVVIGYLQLWLPHARNDQIGLIDQRFDEKMRDNKLDELRSDVAKLTGQMEVLNPLLQEVVEREMTKVASLPAPEFKDNLTRVNVALTAAKLTNANIPASTITDLRAKLVEVSQSTPYFWGAASALIGYRSIQLPKNLPACFSKTPLMTTQTAIPKQMHYPFTIEITPPTYEDCQVDLRDSPPQNVVEYLNEAPKIGVVFKNSLVIYRAGVIPLLNLTPKLTFTNCAFSISPSNVEDKGGQKLVYDLLLAQNPAAITVDIKPGE